MTQRMKRTLAMLLIAIMIFGTLIYSSTSVMAEESSDLKNEQLIESTDSTAKEDSDLDSGNSAELVDPEVEKEDIENIEVKENLEKTEDVDENIEAASEKTDADGSLKAIFSGKKLDPTSVTLEESGINISSNFNSAFTLHIEAVFPAGSNKILEISLPYGMSFGSAYYNGTANKNTSWYVNEVEKATAPVYQTGSKQPEKIALGEDSARNGTLTYEFKDTTEAVSFDVNIYDMYGGINVFPNLHNIKDAVKVSQSFTALDGKAINRIRKIDNLEIKYLKNSEIVRVSTNNYKPFTNGKGNLPVSFEGNTSNTVKYSVRDSRPSWTSYRIMEDYYISYLVPEGTLYKGLYEYKAGYWLGKTLNKPEIKSAGEKYVNSKGEEKSVPVGKTLYTFRTKGVIVTATAIDDSRAAFVPIWSFEDGEKFPVGTLAEVKMVDVGVKYANKGGEKQEYLPYNEKNLTSVVYEIVEKKESTFVETKYEKDSKGELLRAGYISDKTLNLGAPGQEFIQEDWAGYFIIGNRGTADSQPKRVTLEYDVNKTGLVGITDQFIPRNKDVKEIKDSEIINFKYKLWNAKTGKETDWISWDKDKEIPIEFTITDVSKDKDTYFKAIQYEIDTVPLQTYLGTNGNSAAKGFYFYGKPLTTKVSSVLPDPVPWGNKTQYLSTVKLENIDGSDDILGRTFTGTSGKIYMAGVHQSWGAEGDSSLNAGETKNLEFSILGAGQGGIAGVLNKIWVVSPNGSKIDNWKIQKRFHDGAFRSDLYTQEKGWTSDDISNLVKYKEVPATEELKAKYPNARLYEFDFTGVKESDKENFSRARILGPQMRTKKRADGVKPASFEPYWFSNGSIVITGDYHSDISEKPLAREGGLTWAEMKSDTNVRNEDGTLIPVEYGNFVTHEREYQEDKYNLTGKGVKLVTNNHLTVYAPNKLFVDSAMKETSEPDSAYRTYNINDDTTAIGLHGDKNNQRVDYKLNLVNYTGNLIKNAEVYFPIPKKNEDWGKSMNPKGKFNFDMNLTEGIKDKIPEGYKVSYVQNVKPQPNNLLWKDFNWVEDKDTSAWSEDDWKAVNFVKIERTASLEDGNNNEFVFSLSTDGGEVQKIDAWRPAARYDIDGSAGWTYGQPAAVALLDGIIKGTVWNDHNHNGKIDKDEKKVSSAKVKLFSKDANGNRFNFLEEIKSGNDGKYEFNNLWIGKSYEIEIEIPNEYKDFTITGDKLDNVFKKNSEESDRVGIVDATFDENYKLVEKDAGVINDLYEVSYSFTGDIPKNINAPKSNKVEEKHKVKVEAEPSFEGYNFEGWKVETPTNLSINNGEFTMPSENVKFIGNWIRNKYKVNYVVDGDDKYGIPEGKLAPIDNTTYYFKDKFKPTDKLSTLWKTADGTDNGKQGKWTFTGWSSKPIVKGSEISFNQDNEYIIKSDLTFYGKWEFTEERDVKVTKIWDDKNDKDKIRPDEVTVKLLVDGKESDKELILSKDNNWEGTFKDLIALKDDKEIEYSILEKDVPKGYKESLDGDMKEGFKLTNTHKPKEEPIPSEIPTPILPKIKKFIAAETGDENALMLYAGMTLASVMLGTVILIKRKKENEK